MADRPIIFSAPMVRALLDGRKSQTRRVLRKEAALDALAVFGPSFLLLRGNVDLVSYAPGDRLYVREAWAGWMCAPSLPGIGGTVRDTSVVYRADETDEEWGNLLHDRRMIRKAHGDRQDASGNWVVRPSIHMPRRLSRLTLIVTDVRVQRLQDISEADAVAEGARRGPSHDPLFTDLWTHDAAVDGVKLWFFSARESFHTLWNSLHGPDAWAANPWVVAVSFTVHRCNIDQLESPT